MIYLYIIYLRNNPLPALLPAAIMTQVRMTHAASAAPWETPDTCPRVWDPVHRLGGLEHFRDSQMKRIKMAAQGRTHA